jgi:hypothetical protein
MANKNNDDDEMFMDDLLDEEDEEEKQVKEWFTKYEMSLILDVNGQKLYLGNYYDASQLAYSNPMGIQAVLDVSTEDDYERHPDILYLRVPFPDGFPIPPDKFAQCMAFLTFCWGKEKTILVTCAAGISRSTSVVCGFLRYSGLGDAFTPPLDTLDKALDYVSNCRPIVRPAPNTFNSCRKWLREFPYDGSYGQAEPEGKLNATVIANIIKLHSNPNCEVRKSFLANDNRERHLLQCSCDEKRIQIDPVSS